MLRHRILNGCLIAVFACAGTAMAQSDEAATSGTVDLTAKIHRKWKFRLPAETTKEIGTSVNLKQSLGASFKAGLDGTTLKMDSDGDGTLETTVKGSEGFVVLKNGERRYGVRVKAAPKWTFAPGSTMTGKLDGTRIQLIDQNLNGRFDDIGQDAMVVGRSKAAAFLSNVVNLGDNRLVEIKVAPDGRKVTWKKYEGPAGTVAFKFATQAKVLAAVLRSEDGKHSIAITKAAANVALPAGKYRLHSGSLSLGGNRVRVLTGRSKYVSLASGGSQDLTVGGPIQAEFAYRRQGEKIEFSPTSIWYYGKSGEEYKNWAPLGKSPKITVLEGKTGRQIAEAYFPGSC